MIKILSIRLVSLSAMLALAACASGPEKRTTEDQGPVSARARNELASNNPIGLVHVGEGFERAGDLAGAYKLYAQAMAADPKLVEAQVAVARVMGKLGQHPDSIARLSGLAAQYPHNMDVQRELVEAYVRAGAYEKAAAVLGPLVEGGKASAELLDLAGRLAQVSGDATGARTYFDQALRKAPGNAALTRHMALSFALGGDYGTAVAMLQANLDNVVTEEPAQGTLAVVYALSGQFEAAMSIAKAIMSPEDATNLRLYYALLPKLTPRQQAEAVLFDRVPTDVLKAMKPDGSN